MPENASGPSGESFASALGPPVVRRGALYELDLRELPLFHGLSVLSRALGEMILGAVHAQRDEIDFTRDLRAAENKELVAELHVQRVRVRAEREVGEQLAREPELLQDRLRALFGTLQVERYRLALFPADPATPSQALVFELEGAAAPRFVLERLARSGEPRCSLRLSIESARGRRTDLASLPHVRIELGAERAFIAGSTRISQTLAEAVRREAERGRHAATERRQPGNHLFAQLDKADLSGLERVSLAWNEAAVRYALEGESGALDRDLKRLLLALEDRGVRALLARGEVLRLLTGELPIYVDQSQLGRVLNLSLGEHRTRRDLGDFLRRLPEVQRIAASAGEQPLARTKILLIHHNTSEVLGVIAALRKLGCRDLVVLFVTYAARTPDEFLEALLEVPADELRCLALVHIPDEQRLEGHYQVSARFSHLPERELLNEHLRERGLRFLDAMRCVGVQQLLAQAERAAAQHEELLLIEDGGYLAPLLHEALAANARLADLPVPRSVLHTPELPLGELLGERWLGSIEHTRNGLDRLREVEARLGALARPALTIATSRVKIEVEADEVAATVLTATEMVLHSLGRVLSRRRALVIGSRGAIGSRLQRRLAQRLAEPDALRGLDLVVPANEAAEARSGRSPEARTLDELPATWLRSCDLVAGAAGASVFEREALETWLLEGDRAELLLVSASTKRVEFAGALRWIDELLQQREPRVRGVRVHLKVQDLQDSLSERLYGRAVRFEFEPGSTRAPRELWLAADTTPVNFLFYGVPTEVIDEVLAELLQCALILRRRAPELPPRVLELDRQIDASGALIQASS
ncbi:MAG: hypothetical protein JNM84_18725 [Planctomycetes bacterium]|nr:hypothetical protein [Planctomycetota bacterium]